MSAIFTPLKLALLCYLLGLSAQIIASVIALSQIKKVDSYRSGWVLLSLGLTLMLIMRIDYVYPLFSNVDYSLFKPFLALIISLLLMLGVIKIRSLFDVMHNQEIALYKLAKCDTLTDCLSRYAIFEQGLMMIKLSIRLKRPLAILMIDIDKFKNINDEYGHSYGDHVLIQFVSVCKNALRSIDIVGRFGGDEFIAILPEANLEVALSVIQRIKADISNANAGRGGAAGADRAGAVDGTRRRTCRGGTARAGLTSRRGPLEALADALEGGEAASTGLKGLVPLSS